MEADRSYGMLIGVALGDALGAPFEFCRAKCKQFDGRLMGVSKRYNQWNMQFELAHGQVTDDTEMTIAAFETIVQGYTPEKALKAYHEFVNSGTCCMGNNTRKLLQGYAQSNLLKMYSKKYFKDDVSMENAQSNGHLMRASPFGLVKDSEARSYLVKCDTRLTNPSTVSLQCVTIYVDAIAHLIYTENPDIRAWIKQIDTTSLHEHVKEAILDASNENFTRNVDGSDDKGRGWTCHSFAIALWAVQYATSFTEGMCKIIWCKGDTDTNAAIAGALLGAKFGYTKLNEETVTKNNITTILDCRPYIRKGKVGDIKEHLRPDKYHPNRFYDLLNRFDQKCVDVAQCKLSELKLQKLREQSIYQTDKRKERDTDGILILVCGASRSGKTSLASYLKKVSSLPKDSVCVIEQDKFGSGIKGPKTDGKRNWECFSNWSALLASTKDAIRFHPYVIVEGYTLLDCKELVTMAKIITWCLSNEEICAQRRKSFPIEWNSADNYVRKCVWPAHEEYVRRSKAVNIDIYFDEDTSTEERANILLQNLSLASGGSSTISTSEASSSVCNL